jgi:hypothetical protein
VLVGQVLTADPEVDAAHADVAQSGRSFLHFEGGFIAHEPDQNRERHRADQLLIGEFPAVGKRDPAARR